MSSRLRIVLDYNGVRNYGRYAISLMWRYCDPKVVKRMKASKIPMLQKFKSLGDGLPRNMKLFVVREKRGADMNESLYWKIKQGKYPIVERVKKQDINWQYAADNGGF